MKECRVCKCDTWARRMGIFRLRDQGPLGKVCPLILQARGPSRLGEPPVWGSPWTGDLGTPRDPLWMKTALAWDFKASSDLRHMKILPPSLQTITRTSKLVCIFLSPLKLPFHNRKWRGNVFIKIEEMIRLCCVCFIEEICNLESKPRPSYCTCTNV